MINPNIDEIEYKDDADNKNGDNKVKGNSEADVNEGNENNSDDEDDDDEFYKSSLFNDDNDDLIDHAAYRVPSAKGAGAGCKENPGCPERDPTLMVCWKGSRGSTGKWEKSWKHDKDKERRKSAHGTTTDETITYTGVVSDLL